MVMFGTKRPSITSTWIQSAPAASTARTSSARRPKSADEDRRGRDRQGFRCTVTVSALYQAPCGSAPRAPAFQLATCAADTGREPWAGAGCRRARSPRPTTTRSSASSIAGGAVRPAALAHPMFFYELGRLARVVEAERTARRFPARLPLPRRAGRLRAPRRHPPRLSPPRRRRASSTPRSRTTAAARAAPR